MTLNYTIVVLLFCTGTLVVTAQKEVPNVKVSEQISKYRNDIRGPYKDIRWFCTDGSVRAPKDPCPDKIGPGIQHARYKDDVEALGKNHHIYLGQILAYTDKKEFWDAEMNHSRLKQYWINT